MQEGAILAAEDLVDCRRSHAECHVNVSTLSGGNQQKVIMREFSRPIRLLIASQPTRGLDVGSIEYIPRVIAKRDEGTLCSCFFDPTKSWHCRTELP
jgi:ABC-type uncharacterized transport system ATPase subunit